MSTLLPEFAFEEVCEFIQSKKLSDECLTRRSLFAKYEQTDKNSNLWQECPFFFSILSLGTQRKIEIMLGDCFTTFAMTLITLKTLLSCCWNR